jgi:hypothetical protein
LRKEQNYGPQLCFRLEENEIKRGKHNQDTPTSLLVVLLNVLRALYSENLIQKFHNEQRNTVENELAGLHGEQEGLFRWSGGHLDNRGTK